MRIFIDQNLSPQTTLFLRNLGYDVVVVREVDLIGASDDEILKYAKEKNRILLTFNSDFANILSY